MNEQELKEKLSEVDAALYLGGGVTKETIDKMMPFIIEYGNQRELEGKIWATKRALKAFPYPIDKNDPSWTKEYIEHLESTISTLQSQQVKQGES